VRRRAQAGARAAAVVAAWLALGGPGSAVARGDGDGDGDAEAAVDARAYAARSTTLSFAPALSPLPSVSARAELDASLRFVRWGGLVIEGRAGLGLAGSALGGGFLVGIHTGAAVGVALPLGRRAALVPSVGYDLFLYWQPDGAAAVTVQRTMLELAVSVPVFRHAVAELFVAGGAWFGQGASDLALVAGPRLGVVL
jgi:hypothetical protein